MLCLFYSWTQSVGFPGVPTQVSGIFFSPLFLTNQGGSTVDTPVYCLPSFGLILIFAQLHFLTSIGVLPFVLAMVNGVITEVHSYLILILLFEMMLIQTSGFCSFVCSLFHVKAWLYSGKLLLVSWALSWQGIKYSSNVSLCQLKNLFSLTSFISVYKSLIQIVHIILCFLYFLRLYSLWGWNLPGLSLEKEKK